MSQLVVSQEAVKRQIELSAASKFRGYQPLGANVTRYAGGYSRDWHEGIDLYREGQVEILHCNNQAAEPIQAQALADRTIHALEIMSPSDTSRGMLASRV